MFLDNVTIQISSGKGGKGCVGFLREKFVPRGGPNGGDGGRGGNIIFRVSPKLNTLSNLQYKKVFDAQNGGEGGQKRCTGKDGEDMVIEVPLGTLIYDVGNKRLLADMATPDMEYIALKGGRGGLGNWHFRSSTNQTPHYAQPGEPGVAMSVRLELKLIAQVGLLGLPNAGKSTLLSVVSDAKPKIADYPFTTLVPNLGVVKVDEVNSFVMADIPGLIEGASAGIGLGFAFLRHIERTKVLLYLMDGSDEMTPPEKAYETLYTELSKYDESLTKKPTLIVVSKSELLFDDNKKEITKDLSKKIKKLSGDEHDIKFISSATGENIRQLVYDIHNILQAIPEEEETSFVSETIAYEAENTLNIEQVSVFEYRVHSEKLESIVRATDLDDSRALYRLHNIMTNMGVDKALKDKGVKAGDVVKIGEFEFDYVEW